MVGGDGTCAWPAVRKIAPNIRLEGLQVPQTGVPAVITLYNFGPGFGLPDPSPFVMKVETLLKMAKLPYRTDTTGFAKAPKGKIPYIEDDGVVVPDSTFIRWHL